MENTNNIPQRRKNKNLVKDEKKSYYRILFDR